MGKIKTFIIVYASALLFITSSWLYAIELAAQQDSNLDQIAAVVDEDVITYTELDQEIVRITTQLQTRGGELPPRDALQRQVLERMIVKRLQLQTAERLGIKIDDATLDKAISNLASKNGLTLLQLRDEVEKKGFSFAQFRDNTRQQLLIMRLQTQEVVNRITVTPQEIETFLQRKQGEVSGRETVHLQHILVATPEGASPEAILHAQDKVERLLKQLRTGDDFAKVALISSDGRQALEGGDLGWLPLSQVPTIATEAASSLKPGEISQPIRDASGFHIFRVAEVRGGEPEMVTQIHAQHILIKTNELVSDIEAEGRLNQLRIRLVGGEAFSALARSNSEDTASAIKGGDLGWLNPGDTVPEFEEQMGKLALGEISPPFRSPFGWHIVQVLERRDHDNTDDARRAKALQNIRTRKTEEAADLWLRRLRDEAYVEIRLDQPTY